jgi:beta-phosphoglucomutase-like phosphatase (HAD superfamily)
MIVKTRMPHFYYEYKKNRTQMLKEREPAEKEPYYKQHLSMLEQERLNRQRAQEEIEEEEKKQLRELKLREHVTEIKGVTKLSEQS